MLSDTKIKSSNSLARGSLSTKMAKKVLKLKKLKEKKFLMTANPTPQNQPK
jgi:hypothetical protein